MAAAISLGELGLELDCPVCLDKFAPPVFQCENGHLVCRTCIPHCPQCPMCRVAMPRTKIRNIAFEKMLTKISSTVSIPADQVESLVEKYSHPSYTNWVPCSNGDFPNSAVQGGTEDGAALYVARAHVGGALTPGKFHSGHRTCYVSWGCEEHEISSYEVLVANPGGLIWSASSNGQLVWNAVVGGLSESNEELFIGRFLHNGVLTPGKIHPSHRVCYIPHEGREIRSDTYEILLHA